MSFFHNAFLQKYLLVIILFCIPVFVLAQYSADEDPRETPIDPGDIFLPGPVCEVDDGDGSCPAGVPNLNVPNPQNFDLDAYSHYEPLEVCPAAPPYLPGILFSFDDGDPGPGSGLPNNSTELFFYDHCLVLHPTTRYSYYTSITETALGLGLDPPPLLRDDDVDAYETRRIPDVQFWDLLFSPDTPSLGGFPAGSEGNIYRMNSLSPAPFLWATPASLGVPDPEKCDIDGISTIFEEETPFVILFTTDASAPCGLDPGDIYVSNNAGSYWLYADDVTDMKIAVDEYAAVDIDALAINYYGNFDPDGTYEPDDPNYYKADWPNYAPSGMPDFSQDHAGWPLTFCGPTSVADSFWWFDSELECDSDRLSGDSLETEPNDTAGTADRLGEVPILKGTLASNTDADWYRFEIPGHPYRTCRVRVSTCALRQPAHADTIISLYDGSTGTPGTLLASNDDGCPPDLQSEITYNAGVLAGRRYFVKVEPGPSGTLGNYVLTLGLDCYPLVTMYNGEPDDHSNHNVRPLIEDLSTCMNTDDVQGTGSGHKGTRITDMQSCIDQWLINSQLDDRFTETTVLAPFFDEVEEEIEKSEDVILLLGFYWDDGSNWIRCGGHYVTSAGVDSPHNTITLSDPKFNNAEAGGSGRVRGPDHANHAPTITPPPSHDDAQNLSHDRYHIGPSNLPAAISKWSLPSYATVGGSTVCQDVRYWCATGYDWGQNWPGNAPPYQSPCPGISVPISVEVEAMVDVSPLQTPICIFLDTTVPWDGNLRIDKNPCTVSSPTAVGHDVIRGKMCNMKFNMMIAQVDLGHVTCLYDDVWVDHYDELSPDDTGCFGGWFYLIRRSTDLDYGAASSGEPRVPNSGGCP